MIEVDVAEEQAHWLLLTYRCGLTARIVNEIITGWCQRQGRTLREFFRATTEEWRATCNLREKTIKKLEQISRPLREVAPNKNEIAAFNEQAALIKQLAFDSVYVLNRLDNKYPTILNTTLTREEAPPLLFYAGDLNILERNTVAIIGSRNANDNSVVFAREAARCLAEQGANVISGYARGVDRAAYEGATSTHGSTTVVLPHGINKTNNAQLYSLLPAIASGKALLLSQFHPNAAWMVSRAMERNKVVAGLAQIVIVTEAKPQGGTWNSALDALAQNRPVYACRTDTETQPEGNEALIERGARPLYWPSAAPPAATIDAPQANSELRKQQYSMITQQIANLLKEHAHVYNEH